MSMKNRFGGTETALARHETYQTGFKRMAIAAIVASAAAVTATGAAWWAFTQKPEPRYFIAREDGGIIPLTPVTQPYLNDGQVTNFAVEAITRSLTFNFVNWRQDLAEASEYFERPNGWNNFLQAIEGSGMLDFVRNRRLISSVVANGAVIVKSGPDATGRFSWVVQVPITITYQSSSEQSTEDRMAEVQISRLPTWQTSRGVGITRVLVK
ncbi:type IVB secretion system apparatus protein IcmL/DotI [Leisingera caerulea]|uniref:type IVB secretion system apparatus protein IcmL/DotI n=1 Tax=Leisingera caerulea TaxID=506591 RepID=UPI000489DE90|nr:type IVB secretion system apparatus protein IcmL/DotI [Leisingera caerulea]